MWAIEYHCGKCRPWHAGRFFKQPDESDLANAEKAAELLARSRGLPIPDDRIPAGDETTRLHRWGYSRYREMFTPRQLLGLGTLLKRIKRVVPDEIRHALLTVFSDFLRYQNLLCRYDTYALKCQDIFSVHGFPVGLVQCENSLLGIPKVGSGAFRHFVEKYLRAKQYCTTPFETMQSGTRKYVVPIEGERIEAMAVQRFPHRGKREAWVRCASGADVKLPSSSLDGVFTDPPYFDNVQYAELMDFCFVWLRLGLKDKFKEFKRRTTRCPDERTGNETLGRGIEHFTEGLSVIFKRYADALRPGAPFVFTYHHNEPAVYAPVVVAILDAGLDCTATLPAAAEMNASLHIHGTGSSVLDSVFVCRTSRAQPTRLPGEVLPGDCEAMRRAGIRLSRGDIKCLVSGHIARISVNRLRGSWSAERPLSERLDIARDALLRVADETGVGGLTEKMLTHTSCAPSTPQQLELNLEETV